MSRKIHQRLRLFTYAIVLSCVQPCLAQDLNTSTAVPKADSRPGSQPKRKVWTNEDLTTVRKPSDTALDQETAHKQAEQGVATQSSGSETVKQTRLHVETPKNVEQADRLIAEKKEEIAYQELTIATVKERLVHPESDQTEHLKSALKQLREDLDTAKLELNCLLAARQELSAVAPH
jgi:hypothetical protein